MGRLISDVPKTASVGNTEQDGLVGVVVEVRVVYFSQQHHQDGHKKPREVGDVEGRRSREEDDEHHHESYR